MVNKKFIDIAGLTRYNENLKTVLGKKQDNIDDLDAIRSGAAAGATALQSVPAEYVTEDELTAKGFATTDQVDAKQDIISDLETIRTQAAAGAVAEQNAKDYADGLAGNYEEAGAAAQALADAKADAAALNEAMDTRVKGLEAIDHVKLAADASAAAVATVLDGAPEKFDTLKEVAEWISSNESASSAADLVTRVAALETIDHKAYVAADEVVLNSAKSYADGLASNYDAAGAAAQALVDAKAYTDGKVDGKFDEAGAADAALASAKAYTDTEVAKKQNIIEDLATIRSGAAAGATALQAVPAEYVTESELAGMGYLTESDFEFATYDDIDGLFA